ncbi:MAG: hypothetical protein HZA50_01665 [Planctomycetes bacterium]|nr:hypothetical protein [Planctomycetota bacterium]
MGQAADNLTASAGPPNAAAGGSFLRQVLLNDGWAMLATAVATVIVELGAYWLARAMDVPAGRALVAAMAVSAVWLAVAAPAAAAWGGNAWSAMMRCGTVADASGIVLIVLWLVAADEGGHACLTFAAAVKIYCQLAAMDILAIAFVCACRSPAGRSAMALAASACMFVALASPFWAGWWLTGDNLAANQSAATWLVAVNPFFAILSCINEIRVSAFDWLTSDVMYQITRMSDYVAPRRVEWYETALAYLAAAALACVVCLVARLVRPKASDGIKMGFSSQKRG